MSPLSRMEGKGTFQKGIHPPDRKEFARDVPIDVLPVPGKLCIPLLQHLGAACTVTVTPKQEVTAGQQIGSSEAFISTPVHSPVNGTAGKPVAVTLSSGRRVQAVPVTAGEDNLSGQELLNEILGGQWPTAGLEQYAPEQIANVAKEAGLAGMGGAGFPTYVKLLKNDNKPIDTLLINGCECEPYLTADYRLMVEFSPAVITGALLAGRACGADNICIAVEDNKPLAIDMLQKATGDTGVNVVPLHTKYPQGGEKQTIKAVTGRNTPDGGLPLDIGVVVMNVATASSLARAVIRGGTLTHRIVSVTGPGIVKPGNVLSPFGVSVGELIDYCGGLTADAARIVCGGPMMGQAIGDLQTPVTKTTSGITVLTEEDVRRADQTNCVRCGRCVDVCPMKLVPTRLALSSRAGDWDMAKKYNITTCMECGCCAYLCPASLPLVQLIKQGKALLPRD